MRSRNIKPGFFINEDLAEIDPVGRLLFAGLWCLADREGKLEDRPKRIKGELFRFDDLSTEQIDLFLDKLDELKLIIRYEIEDHDYIKIVNFTKHQSPHCNEKPSIIPDPLSDKTSTMPPPLATKEASACHQGDKRLPPNKQALRPESLIPDSQIKTPLTPLAGGNGCDPDFLVWWPETPAQMRIGKDKAGRVWKRLKHRGRLRPLPEMLAVLRHQKESEAWQREEGRFIPLAEHYLSKTRFLDESIAAREPPPPPPPEITLQNAQKFAARDCPECGGKGVLPDKFKLRGKEVVGQKVCQCTEKMRGP
jgi:hypothetical protein